MQDGPVRRETGLPVGAAAVAALADAGDVILARCDGLADRHARVGVTDDAQFGAAGRDERYGLVVDRRCIIAAFANGRNTLRLDLDAQHTRQLHPQRYRLQRAYPQLIHKPSRAPPQCDLVLQAGRGAGLGLALPSGRLGLAAGHHLLERRTVVAAGKPRLHVRIGREQFRRRDGVADDLGDVDIRDREAVADQIAGVGEMGIEHGDGRPQGLDGRCRDLRVALLGRVGRHVIDDLQRVRLDLGCGPQRPVGGEPFLLHVGGRERAAVLAGEVEVDGQRLVQTEAVVIDGRDVAVGVDLQERGRAGVERGIHRVRVLEAIRLDHRHMLERHAQLGREPQVARGTGPIAAVDRQHCVCSTRCNRVELSHASRARRSANRRQPWAATRPVSQPIRARLRVRPQ